MIIEIDGSTDIDTDRDLSSEERHVVQKLFGWKSLVNSVAEFREKKDLALFVGWNNSGPIRESRTMTRIVQQLEKDLLQRLRNKT